MTDGPTTPAPSGGNRSLVERVKNMIVSPASEWDVIDGESATVGGLYTSYVMILAAIPAVCFTLGMIFFMPRGYEAAAALGAALGIPMITTGSIIAGGVVQYVLSLAGVYIMAMIIDALAPSFGSTKNQMQAFKVAAYYPTAGWIAGVLMLLPQIAFIALIAYLYALYTLYIGLPKLMRTPQDKAVGYFAVTLIVAIVVLGLINYIGTRIVYGGYF